MKIMKKTTYLIVISVITIVCVIAGSIYHFGDFELGWGFPWGFPWGAVKETKVTSVETDDGKVTADTVDLDEFSNIDIDLRIMDVIIEQGDSYSISYECSKKKFVPVIIVADDVLSVHQRHDKLGWNTGNAKCVMTITVPEKKFEEVKVSNDTGDISIINISGKTFTISADTGDVAMTGTDGQSLELYVDTGDLEIAECTFTKTQISEDTGDVKLNNSDFGDTVITADTGDIKITESKLENAEISDNTGDIKLMDCSFGISSCDIKIMSDTGDVMVEGFNDLNNYKTDFSTDMGSVSVNGTNFKKHYYEDAVISSDTDNNNRFTITTDIGDVVVNQK